MKSTITPTQFERGILTSVYKQDIKSGFAKTKSLWNVKSSIFHQECIESQIGVVLRVSLFAIAIIMISF
ncbi:hypothetical protein JL193_05005 [Polaribacter batillariae]|uniref:Uncharacterized protein n=1 Tax=Polaribacter batillariae TaxID=2808900 RepID=A0ABX7SXN1_9FLAO|nr:hypothetical protein [Polaribacter batillariae]QTD38637.1 hypothetical protein JL193_05005 [Polaribacter batillariae]